MKDYNLKKLPNVPPEPPALPKAKGILDRFPLLIQVIIFIPTILIIISFMLVFWLITMPFERCVFYFSGYYKINCRYFWGVTKSCSYKLFKLLAQSNYELIPNLFRHNIYVIKKEEKLVFIMCDIVGLYYWPEENDWVFPGGHGTSGRFAVFYLMSEYGNNYYPNVDKSYYVCLTSKQIKKNWQEKDSRFIGINKIINII